ncbi:MAG: ABC transporter permease [Chloroflexota bacterium]|nr:MAG: ABC transporter permease [Chloroflexota bacterium]
MKWRDALLGLIATIIIWQLLALLLNRSVFPPPTQVLVVFFQTIGGELGRHFLVSAWRVIAAVVLSVALAVPVGLGLGQTPLLNRLFSPLIYIAHPIPKIVFLPIILILFGAGDASKIFIIGIILFFQILVVVRDEAAELRPELIMSVRSIGAGRRALFRFVYFPATIPAVLTALRISVGTAIAVLFFAESFATTSGLGYYILVESWGALRYAQMYAGVLAMSLLGLILYFVIDTLDKRLAPWRES